MERKFFQHGGIDIRIKFSILLLRSLGLVLLMLASPLVMSHETSTEHSTDESGSLVIDRIERERAVQDNRSVLLAHKRNYVLPLTYANQPNDDVFEIGSSDFGQDLDNTEIQFQVSLKAPLAGDLFTEHDSVVCGLHGTLFLAGL